MLRRIRNGILYADRLTRVHLLFFTALWPLLGAASVRSHIAVTTLIALLGIIVCFHVYAYVLNDVLDLPIDRTQPGRAADPLVSGAMRPSQALVIALAQPLLAMGITIASDVRGWPQWVLAAAFGLMGIYNVSGKLCPVPPITDAVQGFAWGSLAVYASGAMGAAPDTLTWLVVADATLFTMFINGIHGSFRDLANDIASGARTTAIWLGARPTAAGAVYAPLVLKLYAWLVLAALVALNALLMLRNDFGYGPLAWTLTSVVVAGANVCGIALQPQLLDPDGGGADVAWRLQMYVMVLSFPLAFIGYADTLITVVFVLLNLLALTLWNSTNDVTRWVVATLGARGDSTARRARIDPLARSDSASR